MRDDETSGWRFAENEDSSGYDSLVGIEVDGSGERPITLHVGPRTDEVVSISFDTEDAWRLARQFARAAAAVEADD